MLLHFPSGTFGLWLRRNFYFDINFAIHIQKPEAKWKKKRQPCKPSFPFGALLSCSTLRISSQDENATGIKKKINQMYKTGHSTYRALGAQCLLRCSPIFSDGTESTAFWQRKHSFPLQHWGIVRLLPMRPPSTQGACHSDGPGVTDTVNIHLHWAV